MRLGRLYIELLNGVKEQLEINEAIEERHLNYYANTKTFALRFGQKTLSLLLPL